MTLRCGLVVLAGTFLAMGCAPDGRTIAKPAVKVASGRQAIVNGTVSVAAQDATVMIVDQGQPGCTGTLIAPNLVLTARHCVAQPGQDEANECSAFGQQFDPGTLSIALGVGASPQATVAKGAKIFVPTTSNMCSFDVALIQLDRDVPNAKVAKVRFTDLAPNETTVAVGYGVDGNDREPTSRMQRTTSILGVGPRAIEYTTKQNQKLTYTIPPGDVATGESTCFGDSGGPLFDAQGAVVAITSRGIPDSPTGGAHGNGCIDAPSIFAGTKPHEQLIRQAAQAAGHPLDTAGAPPAGEEETTDDELDTQSEDDESASEDEETEDEEETKPKRRRKVVTQASCATAAGGPTSSPAVAPALLLGLALAAASRRSRKKS